MPTVGLLFSDDLIDSSRVITTAKAKGVPFSQIKTWIEFQRSFQSSLRILIFDLQHPEFQLTQLMDWLKTLNRDSLLLIGYGSHVDAKKLREAREAGFDRVMPRSQFFETLEVESEKWLSSKLSDG